MSGGGALGDIAGVVAPLALSAMFPGVGTALADPIAGALGVGSGTADALSSGLMGALTSGGISALTGGNPLTSALIGGVGAGLGSEILPTPSGAAPGASGTGTDITSSDLPPLGGNDASSGANGTNPLSLYGGNNASQQLAGLTPSDLSLSSTPATPATPATPQTGASSTGGLGSWLGNSNNLKNVALAGAVGLPALQSLLNPLPKYNVGKTAGSVMATNPGFNASLPQYTQQNTGTPYQGNWYTYGYSGQPSMYNAMPQLAAARGGMVGYAHGGRVRGYAMGGSPVMPPQGAPMPPQGMPPGAPPAAQKPVNPLALQAAHHIGVAIGKHLKSKMRTPPGPVNGPGGGQDDAVPARLSDGEFIMPADVVSALGDGSSNAGGKKLTHMVHNVRQHKATKTFPPKAKNPLSYLKGAA